MRTLKTKLIRKSTTQKTTQKPGKIVTKLISNEPILDDGLFKITHHNNKYYIYKNNQFILLVFPIKIITPYIGEYVDKKLIKLNKLLFPEFNKKYQSLDYKHIKFIASDKQITNVPNQINLEPNEQKSCQDKYFMHNECIDIEINDTGNDIKYFVGSLLQGAEVDSIAHNLPGKYYILIAEDYIKRHFSHMANGVKKTIRGGLNDMAHPYKLDICDKLNEYLRQKYINADVFKYYVKQVHGASGRFITLSAMTMFKTGFSFYEKMGYMYIPDENNVIKLNTPYIQVFDLFLDGLLDRLKIILMPIPDFIKQNQNKTESDNFLLPKFKNSLRLVKSVLKELKPDMKFELKTLHDLYKLVDTDRYSFDYFMKNDSTKSSQKINNRRVLYYSIMRAEIMFILSLIINNLMPNFGINCHKFKLLSPSPQNIFTLDQHKLLPNIYPDYLGQLTTGNTSKPSNPSSHQFKGPKYDNIRCKMTRLLEQFQLLHR